MTTGGGLYRYRVLDIIEVVGFEQQCPLIRFISKESKIADLAGEKLNEDHVSKVLNDAFNQYSLAPDSRILELEIQILKPDQTHISFPLSVDLDNPESLLSALGIGNALMMTSYLNRLKDHLKRPVSNC